MVALISNLFKGLLPERWQAQYEYWSRTNPEFRISNSVFTTITCNWNFRTACHMDANDLKEGFGVMTALRRGRYRGGYLIFPKYRVAVDMHTSDLLLANVHAWHSNSPIKGIPGTYDRVSLVMYYREKMGSCKSPQEERLKAIQKTEQTYINQDQPKLL